MLKHPSVYIKGGAALRADKIFSFWKTLNHKIINNVFFYHMIKIESSCLRSWIKDLTSCSIDSKYLFSIAGS